MKHPVAAVAGLQMKLALGQVLVEAGFDPAEVMAKLQIFGDLGKGLKQYDRVWTRVRTAN